MWANQQGMNGQMGGMPMQAQMGNQMGGFQPQQTYSPTPMCGSGGFQQQQQPNPLGMPQASAQVSQNPANLTWLDEIYQMMGADFYLTLDEAMKAGELDVSEIKNNSDGLLTDKETRDYIEKLDMTAPEATAIAMYTFDYGPEDMDKNVYFLVNQCLLKKEESTARKYIGYIIHLLRGLRKIQLPDEIKVLYRGVKNGIIFDESHYHEGYEFTWNAFTSTTSDKGKAYKFAGNDPSSAFFEIRGDLKSVGHPVSKLSFSPGEEEVIVEPGTHFRVVKIENMTNGKRVMIEVIPSQPVLVGAIHNFNERERVEYRVTEEDIKDYNSIGMSFSPMMFTTPEDALKLLGSEWFPNLWGICGSKDRGIYKQINMLVAATTMAYFPTLSAIKNKKAKDRFSYFINQYVQIQGQTFQGLQYLGELPCGISTKILEAQPTTPKMCFPGTTVYVVRTDTMEAIKQIRAMYKYSKIACLNMGSQDRPGGGWKTGQESLEELLFMRTTLSASLEDYLYPMKNLECIYTEDVMYIRGGVNEGFRFYGLGERFRFDVITTCAFNLRKPVYNGAQKQEDDVIISFDEKVREDTRKKIDGIFSACESKGANVLILGALGCGQFNNPPEDVAMLFKEAIQKYAGHFDTIFFSILDEKPARIFADVIINPGAGDVCAKDFHQNVTDVAQCRMVYNSMTQQQQNMQCFPGMQQPQQNMQCFPGMQQPQQNMQCFSGMQQPQQNMQCFSGMQQPQQNMQCFSGMQQPQQNMQCFSGMQQQQQCYPGMMQQGMQQGMF